MPDCKDRRGTCLRFWNRSPPPGPLVPCDPGRDGPWVRVSHSATTEGIPQCQCVVAAPCKGSPEAQVSRYTGYTRYTMPNTPMTGACYEHSAKSAIPVSLAVEGLSSLQGKDNQRKTIPNVISSCAMSLTRKITYLMVPNDTLWTIGSGALSRPAVPWLWIQGDTFWCPVAPSNALVPQGAPEVP